MLVFYKLNKQFRLLQTKFGYREGDEARRVGLEPMPLHQHVKRRHGEREAGLEGRPDPVHDLFDMADERQHREHRLDEYAILPRTPSTEFEVGGIALGRMEGGITQDNHSCFAWPHEPLKGVIRHVSRGTVPRDHPARLVQHQTPFPADHPAVMREAFAADLLRAATFPYGVDQLDAVGVDDSKHCRGSQEDLGPVLRHPQEAKEPRPLG